ncbi:MAG: RCC1 domain-containing protein [Acidimicrobiales bacterium]
MRRWIRFASVIAATLAAACTGEGPTGAPARGAPRFEITDGAQGPGNAHFFFLPPIVRAPAFSGQFDPSLAPEVRICEWTGAGCGAEIVTFTMTTGRGSEVVRVDPVGGIYIVNWHTTGDNLDPQKTYRIRVSVDGYELGHADVDVVTSSQEAQGVDTDAYVPLVVGRPLVIKFRIEVGALPAIGGVSPIAPGGFHTCGVTLDGATHCWGQNWYGELGIGSTLASAVPVTLTGSAFVTVTSGYYHACGLTVSGQAFCWGRNIEGQLGTGAFAGPPVYGEATPVPVTGVPAFATLSSRAYHTCGVTPDGDLYCWGWNHNGQLGNGDVAAAAQRVPVHVSPGLKFAAVSAGEQHTCGLTPAGVAYCWGRNARGELGNGSTLTTYPYAVTTPAPVVGGLTFRSIGAGIDHTCGLTTSGQAVCWGANYVGQLGQGSISSTEDVTAPAAVVGGHLFATLVTGGWHSCGITGSGIAYCWGDNVLGQLGTGTANPNDPWVFPPLPRGIPSPQQVLDGPYASIAVGRLHTCAVALTGTGYCWGYGGSGELGTGSGGGINATPMPIAGGLTFPTQ